MGIDLLWNRHQSLLQLCGQSIFNLMLDKKTPLRSSISCCKNILQYSNKEKCGRRDDQQNENADAPSL
jgi:hypothetical protein